MFALLEKQKKETPVVNNNKLESEFTTILVEKLPTKELVTLAIDNNGDNELGIKSKAQIVSRGKDDIELRIKIKKSLRESISNLEELINNLESNKESDPKLLKLYRTRFLTAVSLINKFQLEWQKHDLRCK